jgi:hypothetical protein
VHRHLTEFLAQPPDLLASRHDAGQVAQGGGQAPVRLVRVDHVAQGRPCFAYATSS